MEEIKLPKFKTKEELEQFAMGLMTENESLKNVIKRKDATIKELDVTADKCTKDKFMAEKSLSVMKGIINERDKDISKLKGIISELESEIKSLKEKIGENYYKNLYDKEVVFHKETLNRCLDYRRKFEKADGMIHKLLTIVTFMYGLLNKFQAKRVFHAFGEFNAADYRL